MLIKIPPLELAKLWSELVECWHDCNGYGGDTAEIYAYRFMRHDPRRNTDGSGREQAVSEAGAIAARDLYELVELFCSEYGCGATIDDLPTGSWLEQCLCFDH